MKTTKATKIILGGLFFAGLLLCTALAFGAVSAFTLGGVGVSLAMAAAVGTPVQETVSEQNVDEANENIFQPEVIQKITKIRSSNYPLDTIMRNVSGSKPTKAFEVRFYSLGERDQMTTVNTAVSATESSAATKVHDVKLDTDAFAGVNEMLMFQGIKGSDNQNLVGHVVAVNPSTNTYTVMLMNGVGVNGADIPAIAKGTKVSRVGQAMNELDARSEDYAMVPENDSNFCQIIMSTISQGLYEKMLKKEVEFGLNEIKEAAIYDFRGKCEYASLFGVKKMIVYNGKRYYHMEGIYRSIASNKLIETLDSVAPKEAVVDWTKDIFTGNNGSDERYMFAGEGLLAWLGKSAEYQKQMNANAVEYKYGIRFNVIETNFGRLYVRLHKGFRFHGLDNEGLVIDPEYLEYRVLRPMGIRHIDNKANGTELSDSYVIEEAFCPIVTNPDVHAVIRLKSA